MNNKENGMKIKEIRKQKKLTQIEVAKKASISRSYYADVENGRYSPSLETLVSISRALEVPVSYLITDEKIDVFDYLEIQKLQTNDRFEEVMNSLNASKDKLNTKQKQVIIDSLDFFTILSNSKVDIIQQNKAIDFILEAFDLMAYALTTEKDSIVENQALVMKLYNSLEQFKNEIN